MAHIFSIIGLTLLFLTLTSLHQGSNTMSNVCWTANHCFSVRVWSWTQNFCHAPHLSGAEQNFPTTLSSELWKFPAETQIIDVMLLALFSRWVRPVWKNWVDVRSEWLQTFLWSLSVWTSSVKAAQTDVWWWWWCTDDYCCVQWIF